MFYQKLVGALLVVKGKLSFTENMVSPSMRGGALFIQAFGQVKVQQGTDIEFINNTGRLVCALEEYIMKQRFGLLLIVGLVLPSSLMSRERLRSFLSSSTTHSASWLTRTQSCPLKTGSMYVWCVCVCLLVS